MLRRADALMARLRTEAGAAELLRAHTPAGRPPAVPRQDLPEVAAARSWFAGRSVGVILLILGALCVLAAAVVFIAVAWVHELTPDLTLSSGLSYSLIRRPGGSGNDNSFSGAVSLQYAVSPSTALNARYSFFDRISGIPGYSMYQNILLVGITKQF